MLVFIVLGECTGKSRTDIPGPEANGFHFEQAKVSYQQGSGAAATTVSSMASILARRARLMRISMGRGGLEQRYSLKLCLDSR